MCHLPKLWTNQFAHENGKQPSFYLLVLFEVLEIRRDFKLIIENNWIDPPHWSLGYDMKDLLIRIPFTFNLCYTCNATIFSIR